MTLQIETWELYKEVRDKVRLKIRWIKAHTDGLAKRTALEEGARAAFSELRA